MTPAEARAKLALSVADMADLVGMTRQGWHKAERSGVVSPPLERLIAYIDCYGPELAIELSRKDK